MKESGLSDGRWACRFQLVELKCASGAHCLLPAEICGLSVKWLLLTFVHREDASCIGKRKGDLRRRRCLLLGKIMAKLLHPYTNMPRQQLYSDVHERLRLFHFLGSSLLQGVFAREAASKLLAGASKPSADR